MNFKEIIQDKIKILLLKHTDFKISTTEIFANTVIGIIKSGSIKITRLAESLSLNELTTSCVRALERFYTTQNISTEELSFIVYDLLSLKGRGPFTIIIDRTNWKYGKKHINIFVVSILFGDTVIPILIDVSDKAGISNFKERKVLIDKLVALVGKNNIKAILGDREFVGTEWFKYLHDLALPFVFRIKNNSYIKTAYDGRISVGILFTDLQIQETKQVKAVINGIPLIIAATRSKEGELVILAASRIKGNILKMYKLRWFIELFFKSIKSKGFNLEETHITDPNRIQIFIAMITIATCLTVQTGLFKHKAKPISIKKHGNKAFSIFMYGLHFIRSVFQKGTRVFSQELRYFVLSKNISPGLMANFYLSFVLGDNFVGY